MEDKNRLSARRTRGVENESDFCFLWLHPGKVINKCLFVPRKSKAGRQKSLRCKQLLRPRLVATAFDNGKWLDTSGPPTNQAETKSTQPNDPLPIPSRLQCSFNECATWWRLLSSGASWRWDATANGNQFATGAKPKLPVQCVFDCPLSSFSSSLFGRCQKSFSSNWPDCQSNSADTGYEHLKRVGFYTLAEGIIGQLYHIAFTEIDWK